MKYFTEYKKPILTCIGFLFFMASPKAQDPAYARQLFEQGNFAAAKQSVDSFVQTHTANAAGWLLKANIYNAISNNPQFKDLMADGLTDAFIALQKAVQLNADLVNEQLKKDHYQLAYDIYNGFTNDGLLYYNAGVENNFKGNFITALDKFKKAASVGSMIYNNGWGLTAMDTSNICYTAKAAVMAGKEDDAFIMAKKIADAGITQTTGGNSLASIYQWLTFYYKKQKDGANLLKYSQLGINYFSNDTYFNLILIDWYRQQHAYKDMFAAYEQLFAKAAGNNQYQLPYLNDVFNYVYNNATPITDMAAYENKLSNGLKAYIKEHTSSAEARLLLAKSYINQASNLQQNIGKGKNAAPADLLKQSNVYLKYILEQLCKTNAAYCKEARQLLARNYKVMKY
jgi:hypothetical protein